MPSPEQNVSILVSDKAASFIKSRRLINPIILVNMGFRSSGGESCDGCGGGGCDDGQAGPNVPFLNTMLVDGGKPGGDFVKVDTAAGIPVYMARPIYERALQSGSTITVDVKGLVMKKLSVQGLNLTSLNQQGDGKPNCH
jgi:hypothetical protein